MTIVSRKCPNCGAALPRPDDASHVTCEYCQHEFDIERPPPPPVVQPIAPFPPRVVLRVDPAVAKNVAKGVGCFAIGLPIVIIAFVGAILWFSFSSMPGFPSLTGAGGIAGPKLTFEKTVGFVQVNGDATEDIVMQVRHVLAGDEIFLTVFDGNDFHELWTAGPFGTYSQGYQYTHTAILGNRVVVSDFRAQAHVYDLASGTQIAQVPMPDRAKRLCTSPAAGTQVFIEADNGQNAVLDATTGASQPSASPPWGACVDSASLEAPKPPPQALGMQIPGFAGSQVLTDGSAVVAVGERASGIRVPMVVGMSPDGRTPMWSVVIPTVDEALYEGGSSNPTQFRLVGGRLFCAYSLTNDTGRLAALDARTGTRLWESELPSCCAHGVDVEDMRVGPTRLITEQFGQAEVWDVASGRLVGRVTPW
jgi:hypothetical protein